MFGVHIWWTAEAVHNSTLIFVFVFSLFLSWVSWICSVNCSLIDIIVMRKKKTTWNWFLSNIIGGVYAEGYCCSFKSIQTLSNAMDYGLFFYLLFIFHVFFCCNFVLFTFSDNSKQIWNSFSIRNLLFHIAHVCICC